MCCTVGNRFAPMIDLGLEFNQIDSTSPSLNSNQPLITLKYSMMKLKYDLREREREILNERIITPTKLKILKVKSINFQIDLTATNYEKRNGG